MPLSLLLLQQAKAQKVVSHQRKAEPVLGEEKVPDMLDYRGLRRQRQKEPETNIMTQEVAKRRFSLAVRSRAVKKQATKVKTKTQRAGERNQDPRVV